MRNKNSEKYRFCLFLDGFLPCSDWFYPRSVLRGFSAKLRLTPKSINLTDLSKREQITDANHNAKIKYPVRVLAFCQTIDTGGTGSNAHPLTSIPPCDKQDAHQACCCIMMSALLGTFAQFNLMCSPKLKPGLRHPQNSLPDASRPLEMYCTAVTLGGATLTSLLRLLPLLTPLLLLFRACAA